MTLEKNQRDLKGQPPLLQDQQAQLAAIVMSSQDSIISYGLDGTIMTWNPAAEKLYGYSADEAVGMNVAVLERPENRGQMHEVVLRIAAGEAAHTFETTRRRKDARDVIVSITVSPIRDREGVLVGVSGISRDISHRVKSENERNRAVSQLRAISDAVVDAIVASDSRGRITSWNRGAEKMFGYSAEEVLGLDLSFIIPEHLRERHRQSMARVAAGSPSTLVGKIVQLEGLRRDGAIFALDLSLGMWRAEDGIFFAGVMRERKVSDQSG